MAQKEIKSTRDIPAVEELLQSPQLSSHLNGMPRKLAVELIRETIGRFKSELKTREKPLARASLMNSIAWSIQSWRQKEVRRVINATGIIVHTNLGRSPLVKELIDGIAESISGYSNLELDLSSGKRGNRGEACEKYLSLLTGAESAAIVNRSEEHTS